MKRFFLSAALMLTVAVSTTFANDDPGEDIQASFKKEFAGAQSVHWKEAGDYFKANFVFQGCVTEAYFNKEGGLEGTIRSLFFNQLPLAVVTAVTKRFADADVLDVFEINNDNGTSYRVTLKSQKNRYQLMLDASGNVSEKTKLKR